MRRIFIKATLATLFSIAGSLLAAVTVVPAMGGIVDGNAWLMCILCPMLVAFPASSYTFWQSERLRAAHRELSAALSSLAEAHRQLGERARRDGMTGLLNRESFLSELDQRRLEPGALLFIDVDNFKTINDEHGHLAGDEALLAVCAAVRSGLRDGDVVARIGGEEFAALLIGAGEDEAMLVAERIRSEVEAICFRPDRSAVVPLTVSIGGTPLAAGASVSDHMRAADARLYAAKRSGRNRSVFRLEAKAAA